MIGTVGGANGSGVSLRVFIDENGHSGNPRIRDESRVPFATTELVGVSEGPGSPVAFPQSA